MAARQWEKRVALRTQAPLGALEGAVSGEMKGRVDAGTVPRLWSQEGRWRGSKLWKQKGERRGREALRGLGTMKALSLGTPRAARPAWPAVCLSQVKVPEAE